MRRGEGEAEEVGKASEVGIRKAAEAGAEVDGPNSVDDEGGSGC